MAPYPYALDSTLTPIACRLAVEGVPVAAIARALLQPSDIVRETLEIGLADGRISEMPHSDWPATARRADRLPSSIAKEDDAALMVSCMRAFQLTKLMAGFMLVLLKRDEADKTTLHHVIESQRAERSTRPNDLEATDPKMVDVIICKLRQRLKVHGVIVETLWGHGYFISSANKTLATSLIATAINGGTDGVSNPE